MANSVNPDQTAPELAVWPAFTLFVQAYIIGLMVILTLKAPITTAADDKFCNIFPNFS